MKMKRLRVNVRETALNQREKNSGNFKYRGHQKAFNNSLWKSLNRHKKNRLLFLPEYYQNIHLKEQSTHMVQLRSSDDVDNFK